MKKMIFWNTEHLSPNALRIAERAVRRKEAAVEAAHHRASRTAGHGPTRAVTRSLAQAARRASFKGHALSREERLEAMQVSSLNATEAAAERLRNKFRLSGDLAVSAPHVFFCEVSATHPDARNPLLHGLAAGGATLCYAYYQTGASSAFTHCPMSNGWYAGPALPALDRVPKSVTINGTGGPVRCCFWHAPSGNDGQIVATVFAGLVAGGAPFVLFGDLNAQPDQLVAQGVPAPAIIHSGGPTRISGRCLDYAITNVPHQFKNCRPLYNGAENYLIKQKTGSDHMVMVLELK